jgi:hypothetical protein
VMAALRRADALELPVVAESGAEVGIAAAGELAAELAVVPEDTPADRKKAARQSSRALAAELLAAGCNNAAQRGHYTASVGNQTDTVRSLACTGRLQAAGRPGTAEILPVVGH